MARIASATLRPCDASTSTCRSLATISSGLCPFFAISVLLRLEDGVTGRRPAKAARVVVPQTGSAVDGEPRWPAPSIIGGTTMEHFAGIDVSLEMSSVCVVDATGRIVREAKVASEPEALVAWFGGLGIEVARIGLEAGPLSQWLFAAMRDAGFAVELLETRHVRDAFKAMPVKTDRKDARGIAQLMRLGWFRPVHCKSLPAQEVRALLTARKLLQTKHHDVDMSLRGLLRGFGLKVGPTTSRSFAARIRELVEGHAVLTAVAGALLAARETLGEQLRELEKRLRDQARGDQRARLLMSAPGVGVIVALTFAAAVDDPGRFRSSKAVGAHFGLAPRKYQSGETDVTGRISKTGDGGVRTALYEAANVILTPPEKGSALKSCAARLANRG